MKILQISLILLLSLSIGNTQKSIDQLFNKYEEADGVVKMNLTGDVIDLLDDELTKGIGAKIDHIDLLMMDSGQTSISKEEIMSLKADLKSSNYEELINARDNGSRIEIYVDEQGEYLKRIFFMMTSPDQNIFVKVSGKMKYSDFKDIDLSGIKGLEILSKMGEH